MRECHALPERIETGIKGLDAILYGGLIARRGYLLRGGPGLGKTTLGLSFLASGDANEPTLFIGFQEPPEQIRANAGGVGIDTSGIDFLDLSAGEEFFTQNEAYDVFSTADVDRGPIAELIVEAVERIRPGRVFVDSMTQLRFMAPDVAQFRKQTLSFLRYLIHRGSTVLFTSEPSEDFPDDDLQFLADGVISLERRRRRTVIEVGKFRGSRSHNGIHQFRIDGSGFHVFPRQRLPSPKRELNDSRKLGSGNVELDAMLHGGLEAGSVTLLTGPTGIGKSTLAACYAIVSAKQGHPAIIYIFEEEMTTYLSRLRNLGIDIDTPMKSGSLQVEQVEPLRYLADEFTSMVRSDVEEKAIELVVLDSISGFDIALEIDEDVGRPLHAFAKNLSRLHVSVLMVNENRVTTQELRVSDRDINYLADNVIYLRYLQTPVALKKIIGILKKRLSDFDNALYLFRVAPGGIELEPLTIDVRAELSSVFNIGEPG